MGHDYLTVAEVLAMHTVLIRRYGGALGVRDQGALEAALFRPQTGYYQDIVAEAAALLESLAINHPFVDGNKRIAAACFLYFLQQNNALQNSQSAPIISNETLATLTLYIANSRTEESEIVKRLIISVLNKK